MLFAVGKQFNKDLKCIIIITTIFIVIAALVIKSL